VKLLLNVHFLNKISFPDASQLAPAEATSGTFLAIFLRFFSSKVSRSYRFVILSLLFPYLKNPGAAALKWFIFHMHSGFWSRRHKKTKTVKKSPRRVRSGAPIKDGCSFHFAGVVVSGGDCTGFPFPSLAFQPMTNWRAICQESQRTRAGGCQNSRVHFVLVISTKT
jgi:hypothetical protein